LSRHPLAERTAPIVTASYARIAMSKDPALRYDLRFRVVQFACQHSIKAAVREFGCTRPTVRKWLRRYRAAHGARASLLDQSRRPHHCPHQTPRPVEAAVLRARRRARGCGARTLKVNYDLPPSVGAIHRIIRQHDLLRPRRTKAQTRRDLRAIKAGYPLFTELQMDTKDLDDIPYYAAQLARHPDWPLIQYTCRELSTGALFLGFARQRSELHSCCFAAAVLAHLDRTGQFRRPPSAAPGQPRPAPTLTIQTDNGSEFSGAQEVLYPDRGFHALLEGVIGVRHRFIPPGRKNHQADVESSHSRIEPEFFDLERFADAPDFFRQASLYQLYWNTVRPNHSRGSRSPDQILRARQPDRDPRLWALPALDLDQLLQFRTLPAPFRNPHYGGYYVPGLAVADGAPRLSRRWGPRSRRPGDRRGPGGHRAAAARSCPRGDRRR
jgi:transposase-like protein